MVVEGKRTSKNLNIKYRFYQPLPPLSCICIYSKNNYRLRHWRLAPASFSQTGFHATLALSYFPSFIRSINRFYLSYEPSMYIRNISLKVIIIQHHTITKRHRHFRTYPRSSNLTLHFIDTPSVSFESFPFRSGDTWNTDFEDGSLWDAEGFGDGWWWFEI